MKKSFKHLNQIDRDRLEAMLESGLKQNQVAKILKVDPSTVSREVKKRKLRNGKYDACAAQHKARVKRKQSKYQGMKVESDPAIKKYIIEELKEKRSPDEIAGRMKREKWKKRIGKDAIYKWLYSAWGQKYCKYLCTKRYKVRKRRKNKTERVMIPNRTSIHKRPLGAINKTRYKHFEVDTAVAPRKVNNTQGIAIASGIKSKIIVGTKITSMACRHMTKAVRKFQKKVDMKSSTADNGIENRGHEKWGLPTYFADPHSPWQKPVVENSIGLLRRWFFKKGTDWSKVSEKQLQKAISTLNNKYRKSLNYASALEVATAHGIIVSDPNKNCI